MIQYLLHASLLIGLLYGFYRLLLSGETFFGFHRIALVGGIALAFLLPLVTVPAQYSLRDKVTQAVYPIHEAKTTSQKTEYVSTVTEVSTPLSELIEDSATSTVVSQEKISTTAAKATPKAAGAPMMTTDASGELPTADSGLLSYMPQLTLSQWSIVIYSMGSCALLLYLLFQLVMLSRFRRKGEITQQGRYTIVEHDVCDQSFSFGRIIYIHKSADQQLDRDHIIRHEMIHARQLHTIDILIGEVLTIVLWFNPFAWMYKKAIRDNLEFLTDRQMLDDGADTKAYQMSLVRITVPHTLSELRQPTSAVSLANNYNHSTLKQRIIMMNKRYSNYARVWRHVMAVPILALTVAVFNNVVAEPSQVTPQPTPSPQPTEQVDLQIAKPEKVNNTATKFKEKVASETVSKVSSSRDEEAEDIITRSVRIELENHPIDLGDGFINDIVNTTINATVPAVLSNMDLDMDLTQITSDAMMALPPMELTADGKITGRWEIDTDDNCIHFWMRGKNYFSNWTECDYNINDFKTSGDEVYTMTRDAGTMVLTGALDGAEGEGKFTFASDESFQNYLSQEGISGIRETEMLHLFNTDINRSYIAMLKKQGYRVDKSDIVALAVHGVDDDELTAKVTALKSRGFSTDDLEDIIAMSIHGVDEEYMDEIDGLGFKSRRLQDYISMRIHDVDKDLVSSLSEAGYNDLSADEVVSMAIHDVDEEFINGLAAIGYKDLPVDKIVQLAIHNVDPAFVKEVESFGYRNLDLDDIIAFAIHDVDSDYIKELRDAGLTDLDADEITSFAIHDVDTELIASLTANGYAGLSSRDIMQAAIHDVDTRLIRDLKEAGLTNLDFDELINFAIHDVDGDYIIGLKKLGIKGLDAQDYINGSIHDVDIDFIEDIMALGFEGMTMSDLVELRIHDIDAKDIKRLQEEEGEKKDLNDYRRRLMRRNW